jgi:hexosaminidase
MAHETLFKSDRPVTEIRAVHLDLKGVPPTADRLVSLLDVFAAARYNAVLVEWEDAFPWQVDKNFRSETAYKSEQVDRFHAAAERLGIAVIPLVQCLGHAETPLSVPGYERLREVPHQSDVLNPLADGARQLIEQMVDDVVARMPNVRHFHLGGDEAWTFGTHPETKAYIEKHGKGALYLHHVDPILDKLNDRGIRPLLWHDMMCDWSDEALDNLADKADLVVWGYGEHPDQTVGHYNTKHTERFKQHGITLWGGTAYKGADGHNADLPNIDRRQANALGWAEVARRYRFAGLIATAWSRYSTHNVQNEPIDAALDSLINVGVIMHDGRAPEGGIVACIDVLERIGERKRWEACRNAMQKLTDARQQGWQFVRQLREQLVTATQDARRRSAPVLPKSLERLDNALAAAETAATETRQAFTGLIGPIWIERYLAERIEPIRDEQKRLSSRVRHLNPGAMAQIS